MTENSVTIKGRIINKHDIEANWNQAVNFYPRLGEIIIYDPDNVYPYPRYKVGIWNGEESSKTLDKLVKNLPFTAGETIDVIKYNAATPAYTASYDSANECLTLTALESVKCVSTLSTIN